MLENQNKLVDVEQDVIQSMLKYINTLKERLKKIEKWEYEKNLYKSKLENIKNKNIILHNQLTQINGKLWITRFFDSLFCRNNKIGIEIDVESDRWSDLSLKGNDDYKNCYHEKRQDEKVENESPRRKSNLSNLGNCLKSSIEDYLIGDDELY